jgi:methylmalonyl-CoA mutase
MNKTKQNSGKYLNLIRNRTAMFSLHHGRRPRILITRIDPIGSDRGVKILATALADMGFDVDISTYVQSPVDIARLASENDVHAVGIAGITDQNRELISNLMSTFDDKDEKSPLVVLWTHYPPHKIPRLFRTTSDRVLILTLNIQAADGANRILDLLEQPS